MKAAFPHVLVPQNWGNIKVQDNIDKDVEVLIIRMLLRTKQPVLRKGKCSR